MSAMSLYVEKKFSGAFSGVSKLAGDVYSAGGTQ